MPYGSSVMHSGKVQGKREVEGKRSIDICTTWRCSTWSHFEAFWSCLLANPNNVCEAGGRLHRLILA
jgi:hypothetical protein